MAIKERGRKRKELSTGSSGPNDNVLLNLIPPSNFAGTSEDWIKLQMDRYISGGLEAPPLSEHNLQAGRDFVSDVVKETLESIGIVDQIKNIAQKEIKSTTDKIKNSIETEQKKVTEQTEKIIRDGQIKLVEMLGIFVSLFTFISLDFSLLKGNINLGVSVSLILIAGGMLLAFLLVMHYILFQEENKSFFAKTYIIWLISVTLLGGGGLLLGKSIDNKITNSDDNLNINASIDLKAK